MWTNSKSNAMCVILKVSDRLTGSDILVVSGDLIMDSEGLRGLTDMHRLNR